MQFQCIKISQYFPKSFKSFGRNINVKVDVSNYASKTDLKNVRQIDTSHFALKTNLASLKTEIDKLDIDKLAPVPVDLSKLSDVAKNDFCQNDFILKTIYQKGKTKLEKKIPNVTDFVKKTKLTELVNKIPKLVV